MGGINTEKIAFNLNAPVFKPVFQQPLLYGDQYPQQPAPKKKNKKKKKEKAAPTEEQQKANEEKETKAKPANKDKNEPPKIVP